jgi:hypothetical protein
VLFPCDDGMPADDVACPDPAEPDEDAWPAPEGLPLAPPCFCSVGNGDSGPPPWLEVCPLLAPSLEDGLPPGEPWLDGWPALDPCPELGLPPDDEGEGEDGVEAGDWGDGLGNCGIEDDCVELVDEQPASARAPRAGQIMLPMVLSGIPDNSRARSSKVRSAAPSSIMLGSAQPLAGSTPAATCDDRRCRANEIGAHQERA